MNYQDLKSHPKVKWRSSERYPDFVVAKYAKDVFFKNAFDAVLEEARGHVYDAVTGDRVVNAFTKIYNRFERNTDIPRDELVTSIRKVNGFMAAVTWSEKYQECVVSTTGSLDSDFVGYAKDMLPSGVYKIAQEHELSTFLFEIVHPNDPHIVPEKTGAYLIGSRAVDDDFSYMSDGDVEWSLDYIANEMGVMRPEWETNVRFSDVVQKAKECEHEGFVVYSETTALKIKSPYYLACKAAARKADILSLDKSRVDEEYFDLIDYLVSIKDEFNAADEQSRLLLIRAFLSEKNQCCSC